jgi:hypothetical protein
MVMVGKQAFNERWKCETCDVTLLWPNIAMQYQKQESKPANRNRVVIKIELHTEDMGNPLTTEFPVTCASPQESEALANRVTAGVRNVLERLNVQTA